MYVRLGASWMVMVGTSGVAWLGSSGIALAATAKAVKTPSIADDAVDSVAHFINFVAHYTWSDYGIALIIVTILIRLLTMPLIIRSLRNTKKTQALQPRLQELKKQYGKDPKKYQEEMMNLYKAEGVNPVAGCAPMLVQTVVLTVLYRAIYTDQLILSSKFLGILPLGVPDHTFILPVLAAVTSYFQTKMSMVSLDQSQKFMVYIFPVMIFVLSIKFNAGLALYWVISNIFTIVQTYFTRVKPTNQGA